MNYGFLLLSVVLAAAAVLDGYRVFNDRGSADQPLDKRRLVAVAVTATGAVGALVLALMGGW